MKNSKNICHIALGTVRQIVRIRQKQPIQNNLDLNPETALMQTKEKKHLLVIPY